MYRYATELLPSATTATRASGVSLRRMLWPIVALLTPVACAEPPRAPAAAKPTAAAAPITRITLEEGCFGCATGSVLVLQRDGRATHTVTGNARHGTASQTATGTVALADFEAVALQATTQGFFDEPEIHDNPQQRDGAWTVVRLTRNGQDKQVFRREGVAAPGLVALEAAIKAVQARIAFGPKR